MDKRDRYLRRMCCTSGVAMVISVACVVVGVLSIMESAPKYLFPYCLGGSAIAGFFVMTLVSCNICLYCKYLRDGRVHEDEDTIKSWVMRQILLISLTSISLVVGVGISGIWGMVKATDVINFEEKFKMKPTEDVPYAKDNLVYAICSFVFVLVLAFVQIYIWCTCLCYTDTYGFTDTYSSYGYHQRYRERAREYHANSLGKTTNEYRPSTRTVANSEQTSDINRTRGSEQLHVNIPRINDSQSPSRSVPIELRDFRNDRPFVTGNTPTNESSEEMPRDSDTPRNRQPPPQYEELIEEPPPSYNQVMTEGAFVVTYV